MATARIDRSDDTAPVLKIIATVSDTEDAVTKQWQGIYVADGTSPAANKMGVDASGNATVKVNAALPAGTNAIGKLAANSGVDIGDVDVTSVPASLGTATGAAVPANAAFVAGTDGTNARGLKTDAGGELQVDVLTLPSNASVNLAQVAGTNTVTGGTAGSQGIGGIQAHDAADSGNNPVKIGAKAIAHGANPTAVAAGDVTDIFTNRHGIPFVIGGHMNTFTEEFTQTDADGAQTNVALKTVAAGTKIVITQIQVLADQANTVETSVRIGFAAATLGAASTTPVAGIVASHAGIVPGSGISRGDGSGILGIGGDGEDLRITISDPVGGNNVVVYSGYTIES